jgi:hypothetical protein
VGLEALKRSEEQRAEEGGLAEHGAGEEGTARMGGGGGGGDKAGLHTRDLIIVKAGCKRKLWARNAAVKL